MVFNDKDSKEKLPIHLILGVGEYAKIKTSARQKVGVPGDPVAELTKFGLILVSPGQGVDLSQIFLTQTSSVEYEELCRMDVLGLADTPVGDQEAVYEEFKEQLSRSPDGWYESGLPWKGDLFSNGTNEANSQRRLQTLVSKLRNIGNLEEYDNVIQEQLKDGVGLELLVWFILLVTTVLITGNLCFIFYLRSTIGIRAFKLIRFRLGKSML